MAIFSVICFGVYCVVSVMGFVTYVLMVGLVQGMQQRYVHFSNGLLPAMHSSYERMAVLRCWRPHIA